MSITTEQWWTREFVPDPLWDVLAAIAAHFHLPPTALGAKGNTDHDYGYHRSWEWILNSAYSAYGSDDYSVQLAEDNKGNPSWVCAIDFSLPPQQMKEVSARLLAASQMKHPGLKGWREWFGTVDGETVVGWDLAADEPSTSDSSHTKHIHMSRLRGHAGTDGSGILPIIFGEPGFLTTGVTDMIMVRPSKSHPDVFLVDGVGQISHVRGYAEHPGEATQFEVLTASGVPLKELELSGDNPIWKWFHNRDPLLAGK